MTDYLTEAAKSGRIPVVFVELDMDVCTRTYGSSPCTAAIGTTGTAKCYNTFSSCQDTANYNKGVKTYRFCESTASIPVGLQAIPLLKKVTFASQVITPGKGLGVRGSVTVRFSDAPWTDVDIDPYFADRATPAAGTFWGRFRARNPYYEGRAIRILSGYITSPFTWDTFQTRAYIIDSLSAVLKGDEAQIVGKDILKLADDKKALFPAPSSGTLSASISNSATSLTVAPTGAGADYPSSGKIAVSGEVMSYTRSGDVFAVTRAQSNTVAEAHDADDTVQLVGEFVAAEIQDVIYDLLTVSAGIDMAYIDKTAWDTERDTYLTGVWNLEQPEPVGVNTLLAEITEQGNCRIWWDEINQKIRFRAIRPLDSALPVYTDDLHFGENSVSVTEDTKQRVSTVLIYFGRLNPTEKLDDLKNYAVRYIQADTDAISANEYGSSVTKRICSRWFRTSSLARVQELADALLMTYRDPPRLLDFRMDPRHDLRVGDIFRAQTRYLQGVDGAPVAKAFEVIEAQEEQAGHVIRYRAQEMPANIPTTDDYPISIFDGDMDVVLYDLFVIEHGVPVSAVVVTATVQSGALVSATSTSIPALRPGSSWPSGTTITLINNGTIAGRGGDGGHGGSVIENTGAGVAGAAGGLAIDAAGFAISIDNTAGIIAGGSGGGGGGGAQTIVILGVPFDIVGGGGGGGGYPLGAGGVGGTRSDAGNPSLWGDNGSAAGSGGSGGAGGAGNSTAGDGGAGGGYAATGTTGASSAQAGGAGGAAGDCIHNNSNITWIATGTRYGTIS